MKKSTGFLEIEHTADWEIQVWAPDFTTLFAVAAQGMYELSNTVLADSPRVMCDFEILFIDHESLLVDFLSELLFLGEDQGIAFDGYQFDLNDNSLKVHANGAPIKNQSKEIKAVTYHGMKILEKDSRLEVRIVFDV